MFNQIKRLLNRRLFQSEFAQFKIAKKQDSSLRVKSTCCLVERCDVKKNEHRLCRCYVAINHAFRRITVQCIVPQFYEFRLQQHLFHIHLFSVCLNNRSQVIGTVDKNCPSIRLLVYLLFSQASIVCFSLSRLLIFFRTYVLFETCVFSYA